VEKSNENRRQRNELYPDLERKVEVGEREVAIVEAMLREQPTVCGVCGLYYLYPGALDYEHNPCPHCRCENNGVEKR
jgi:hypothetical protein